MAKKAEMEEANVNAEENTSSVTPAYDPWKDMRQVYIPKRTRGEQNTLEVGVNDRTYFIPKETWTEVPEPVWEVIDEMQRRQKALDDYLNANSNLQLSQGKA